MKKKILLLFVVLVLSLCVVSASPYNDFALMLGAGNFFNPSEGIAVSYGMTLGLTKTLDLSVTGMSELVPDIGNRNIFLLEIGMTISGARNTGSKVAGICINTEFSIGGFYRTDNGGAGVYLGISPLTIGSPTTTRRERSLRTNIGWDFVNRKLMVTFSPLDIEVYIVGTYRDWV